MSDQPELPPPTPLGPLPNGPIPVPPEPDIPPVPIELPPEGAPPDAPPDTPLPPMSVWSVAEPCGDHDIGRMRDPKRVNQLLRVMSSGPSSSLL